MHFPKLSRSHENFKTIWTIKTMKLLNFASVQNEKQILKKKSSKVHRYFKSQFRALFTRLQAYRSKFT